MTTAHATDGLSSVLGPIHERWISAVDRRLAPAMVPGADFWERWGMARFLTDQLETFYRLEASLLEWLATVVAAEDAARLRQGLGEIERTRAGLVALGRRRGTRVEVARQAKTLLARIRQWSHDLEQATRHLPPARLSPAHRQLIEALQGAAHVEP